MVQVIESELEISHVSESVRLAFQGFEEVQQTRDGGHQGQGNHTVFSYDQKPGIQAGANIAPDLATVSGKYAAWDRDYEYKRHGTLSLLAGIDLYDGHVLGLVKERHRGREFIEFLAMADAYYASGRKLRIILDNHPSHISKETDSWLRGKPNRFEFVYTPKHGSRLNLIEVKLPGLSSVPCVSRSKWS